MDRHELEQLLFEESIPPRETDVLFRDDMPGVANACLNVMHGGDEIGYTEGYRRGARLLTEHILREQRDQDYLVYPIIFLYRHHVELVLKNILHRIPYLLDREFTDAQKKHLERHRLDLLWQDLKMVLSDIGDKAGWGRLEPADEAGITRYIQQITELDPESFSFRYPRSKKGDFSLPPDLKLINLGHFAEMMERLADYLDGLDAGTSQLEDYKAEMEAEWRSNMAQDMDYR